MDHEKTVRRSKIYTYFYGRNKWLQIFLILAGVLLIMFSSVAGSAVDIIRSNTEEKLYEQRSEASSAYTELYNAASGTFKPTKWEAVEAKRGDEYYQEKKAYNEALEEFNKLDEKLEKLNDKKSGQNFLSTICKILGIVSVLAGFVWIIYKNVSFNREGQEEYDQELSERREAAKQKGLEKLNLAAEQVEIVEPVVLTGVANTTSNKRMGTGGIRDVMLHLLMLMLGILAVVIVNAILGALAKNLFMLILVTLIVFGGLGAAGYFLYKKFEVESYVFPGMFKTLAMLPPQMITKVGSDANIRVSLPAITVYMFGEEQLYMYYQYFDIVTGMVFFEGVHEYFYEDIVGVASSQETKRLYERLGGKGSKVQCIEYLRESITVVTSGCTYTESYIVDVGNSLLDTSFLGMRNLIRQKKEGNKE